MFGEEVGPALVEPLGEDRRALDVREQEGDGATWRLHFVLAYCSDVSRAARRSVANATPTTDPLRAAASAALPSAVLRVLRPSRQLEHLGLPHEQVGHVEQLLRALDERSCLRSEANRLLELTAMGKDAGGGDLQLGAAAHVDLLDGLPRYREVLVGLVESTLLGKDAGEHRGKVSGARPLPRSLQDLQTGHAARAPPRPDCPL